jgi:DnaJ-class molecular chaperone
MTLMGVIGIALFSAFVVGTAIFAVLRLFLVNWCPACSGRGHETDGTVAWSCTACGGRGVLRVPEVVPEHWEPAVKPQRRAPRSDTP